MGYIITAEKDTDLCRKGCKFAVEGQSQATRRPSAKPIVIEHNIHYAKLAMVVVAVGIALAPLLSWWWAAHS